MIPVVKRAAAGIGLWALLLTGCGGSDNATPLTLSIDFNTPGTDWLLGASDYTPDTAPGDVRLDVTALPAPFSGHALTASGMNRSDDLFVFVKKRYAGLVPGAVYEARVALTILAALPKGCFGVGGAPAESVYVKAGVSRVEPVSELRDGQYLMNIDKGNQAVGGAVGQVLGDLGNSGTDCHAVPPEAKAMTAPAAIAVQADAGGAVWVFFGIDSGFESGSALTLMSAKIVLTPAPR